jgi:hypothetical protein
MASARSFPVSISINKEKKERGPIWNKGMENRGMGKKLGM